MVLHSVIIGVILYIFMVFGLGQQKIVAQNRSILIASCVLDLWTFQTGTCIFNKALFSLFFLFSSSRFCA